jgi:hypothetical protein
MHIEEIARTLKEAGQPRLEETPFPYMRAIKTPGQILAQHTTDQALIEREALALVETLSKRTSPSTELIYTQDTSGKFEREELQRIREKVAEVLAKKGLTVIMQEQGSVLFHTKWHQLKGAPNISSKHRIWEDDDPEPQKTIIIPPSAHISPEIVIPCQPRNFVTFAPTLYSPKSLGSLLAEKNTRGMEMLRDDHRYWEHIKKLLKYLHDGMMGCANLHEHGIAHGDIKPYQILINEERITSKLSDFETATQTEIEETADVFYEPRIFVSPKYSYKWYFPNPPGEDPISSRIHRDTFSFGMCILQILLGDDEFFRLTEKQKNTDAQIQFYPFSNSRFRRKYMRYRPEIFPLEIRDLLMSMLNRSDVSAPTVKEAAQRLNEEYQLTSLAA